MKNLKDKYGDWVAIIGAAKGIGEGFSNELAKQNMNLILVDNDAMALTKRDYELKTSYAVKTETLFLDLNDQGSTDQIIKIIKERKCRLVIYNAAFSRVKKFKDLSTEELDSFVGVNIRSLLHLVHAFSRYLIGESKNGGIIMMSSLAGLLGMQLVAPYAASKAFTWNLAEALFHELKENEIDVMACIAGATNTETYLATQPRYKGIKPQIQNPREVAKNAIENLGKKALYISGWNNRFNYFILTRILPRKMAARIANKVIKEMYPNV